MDERILSGVLQTDEADPEVTLRPRALPEFIGQPKLKETLGVFIEAARRRREPLDHVLLCGPPGLGKTTLAHIIAREMQTQIRVTSGPVMEKAGDLAALLTNLAPGDVLFIDEIHRLPAIAELPTAGGAIVEESHGSVRDDVISALVNLGYQRPAVEKAVERVLKASDAPDGFEETLRQALRHLSR